MCLWKRWKKIQFIFFFPLLPWVGSTCIVNLCLFWKRWIYGSRLSLIQSIDEISLSLNMTRDTIFFLTRRHSPRIKMVVKISISRGSTIDCGAKIKWSIWKCKRDWICYELFTTAKQLWIQNRYQVGQWNKPF